MVRADVSSQESTAGLLLFPERLPVTIASQPVDNLTFSQRRPTITGGVTCQGPCPASGIRVVLKSTANKEVAAVAARPANPDDRTIRFSFPELLPSKYELEARHVGWCFDPPTFTVQLGGDDVRLPPLKHLGRVVNVQSPHDVDVALVDMSSP